MVDRTLSVAAGPGLIMVCVNSGIDGNVQAELTVTLTAIEGKASEYPTHYVCHACTCDYFALKIHCSKTCYHFWSFNIFPYRAAEPEDFTSPDPAMVVFPVGGTSSTLCSNFTIQPDTALEGNHDFTVAIVDVSPGSPHAMIDAASNTTTVVITDDEGM